ncbi:CDP-alcohol phosphatidyltransferase family protein [Candidatus Parcubacteria bacterium]|nr:CDP-alcohol phosphatidyltransferase family protein [Candidatus Parcubacteria bacterium]
MANIRKFERATPTIIDTFLKVTILWMFPRWILPNHVTIFRFLSIPFVVYALIDMHPAFALFLFVISAFSDAVDGALARTRNQVTNWGKMYDPLADKLLIGSVAAIVVTKYLSLALTVAIILIELIIIFNAIYRRRKLKIIIFARLPGKLKMILQSIGLGLLLVYSIHASESILVSALACLYGAIAFGLISLLVYHSA